MYVNEIADFVDKGDDAKPDFFDLDKMFSLFMDEEGRWQYNLNSTFYLIDIPDEVCEWYICPTDMHWGSISWKVYGSPRLAWFLMKLNGVRDYNIFDQIKAGTRVKTLNFSQHLHNILNLMEQEQNMEK